MIYETAFIWFPIILYTLIIIRKEYYAGWMKRLFTIAEYKRLTGPRQIYKKKAAILGIKIFALNGTIIAAIIAFYALFPKISIIGYEMPTWQYFIPLFIITLILRKIHKKLSKKQ